MKKIAVLVILFFAIPFVALGDMTAPDDDILKDSEEAMEETKEIAEKSFDRIEIIYDQGRIYLDSGELNEIIDEGKNIYTLGQSYYDKLTNKEEIYLSDTLNQEAIIDPALEELVRIEDSYFHIDGVPNPVITLSIGEGDGDAIIIEKIAHEEKLKIKKSGTEALTSNRLIFVGRTIYLENEEGTRAKLDLLPEGARSFVEDELPGFKVQEMEVSVANGEIQYQVSGLSPIKVLGFIPVNIQETVSVNAAGDLETESTEDHWWNFLVF